MDGSQQENQQGKRNNILTEQIKNCDNCKKMLIEALKKIASGKRDVEKIVLRK